MAVGSLVVDQPGKRVPSHRRVRHVQRLLSRRRRRAGVGVAARGRGKLGLVDEPDAAHSGGVGVGAGDVPEIEIGTDGEKIGGETQLYFEVKCEGEKCLKMQLSHSDPRCKLQLSAKGMSCEGAS